MDVPDQPLNPPEPRCPDYNDYLESECDRLIDEERERRQDAGQQTSVPKFWLQAHRHCSD